VKVLAILSAAQDLGDSPASFLLSSQEKDTHGARKGGKGALTQPLLRDCLSFSKGHHLASGDSVLGETNRKLADRCLPGVELQGVLSAVSVSDGSFYAGSPKPSFCRLH
jgi:hypothetical protein